MRLGEGLGNTAAKGVIMGQTKAVIMSQKQNVSVQVRSQQDFRQVRSQYKSGHSQVRFDEKESDANFSFH